MKIHIETTKTANVAEETPTKITNTGSSNRGTRTNIDAITETETETETNT